ncbi:carbamoyltransferase C-terminal domain-containing protein, partial [Pseudomonas sp. FSL R10-2189]|uniref:carbamoyltransferase C-terminal domain-containing protein n=1 Tax=Pseudomonas sp. FSL R10-2189 TaxID=2662199 RepID=UPI00273D31E6
MPMAPVMTLKKYQQLFERVAHVWKSNQHMIMAMEYRETPHDLLGVAHGYFYPYHHYTGRPQVVDRRDVFMDSLLDQFGGVLINTSFNYH